MRLLSTNSVPKLVPVRKSRRALILALHPITKMQWGEGMAQRNPSSSVYDSPSVCLVLLCTRSTSMHNQRVHVFRVGWYVEVDAVSVIQLLYGADLKLVQLVFTFLQYRFAPHGFVVQVAVQELIDVD